MTSKNRREILRALALITQIGLSMMTSMAISLLIGFWLDRLFGTKFIVIIMLFIGIGASIRSLLVITRDFYREDERKKDNG